MADWTRHKPECREPEPKIDEHTCIEMPDLACSWYWDAWYKEKGPQKGNLIMPFLTMAVPDEEKCHNCMVSTALMNTEQFKAAHGETAITDFVHYLVDNGRPPLYLIRIYGGAQK